MHINKQIQHFNSSQIKAAQPPLEGGLSRLSLELSHSIFWSFVNNINEDHFLKKIHTTNSEKVCHSRCC